MASDALTVNGVKEHKIAFDKVKSCHFTNCQKPWTCPRGGRSLCSDFHREWCALA